MLFSGIFLVQKYDRVGPLVYPDGNVCISILHTGDDKTGYEQASERWSPVQSVEKVILSVISMLAGTSGFIYLSYVICLIIIRRAKP